MNKIVLALILLVSSISGFAQRGHERGNFGGYRNHNQVIVNQYHPRFYRFNSYNGGHFVHRGGYYNGLPYYGGLSIYNGVNIFPCTEFDFVNGYCYPYDYAYYPQQYSGFSVGIHIR